MGQEASLLFLALLCLGCAHCYPQDIQHFNFHLQKSIKDGALQYCGTQLSKAISIVCKGNYNTIEPMQPNRNVETLRYPYKSREEASSFIRYSKRRRRGVSDECCKKACSYSELMTFCGPTPN